VQVDEAEVRLREMLMEAGIDGERAAPRAVWDVFKAFVAEPVDVAATDPDRDMVIAEWKTCEWEG